ncbi:MAG TPA: hypothetical protein VMP38_03290 [Candidatus Acidoferrum sp.]|nr:hypothetical protein [Candidatus Acidoferrum sp.]
MAIVREAIYGALWRLASEAASFATANRRLRHWSDVSPAEQPALFMSQKRQRGTTHQGAVNLPVVWTLLADFYIYVHSSDPALSPAILLNPLIDAIELALAPDPGTGVQDLGLPQMVRHVRIVGEVETAEGVLGDQEMAIIPVEILCV